MRGKKLLKGMNILLHGVILWSIVLGGHMVIAQTRQLPWKGGGIWQISQGYHEHLPGSPANDTYALDFVSAGTSSAIYATRGGMAQASIISSANYCDPPLQWNSPLRLVVVTHSDGTKAEYFHLASITSRLLDASGDPITGGVQVVQGEYLGEMGSSGCTDGGAHLHYIERDTAGNVMNISQFEGKRLSDGSSPILESGGYNYGDQYLSYNYGAASTWHPNGTLIRAAGDAKAHLLENGKKRWVYDQTAFDANGFSWEDVVTVSSEELSCYDVGETIYAQCLLFPSWEGYRVGSLVRQTGTTPVYVVGEDGMLHWLDTTEAEFYAFGYTASMIHDVPSVWGIGYPITSGDFSQCSNRMGGGFENLPNEVSFVIADTDGGVGSSPEDMPNDYSTGNPPPAPDETLAGNNMLFVARFYDGESLQGFSSAGVKVWGISGTGEIAFDGADILAIGCENDVYKTLVHIDPLTGAVKSTFRLAFGNCGTRSRMSLWTDRLYVLSPDGNFVYAIRKSDGALLWTRSSGYGWESDKFFDAGFPPAVNATDGSVYLARQNGSLAAVNSDGTIRWEKDLGGKNFPPKVGPDGTVFYALYDNTYSYVYAFNPSDGSQKWRAVMGSGAILKAADASGVYVKSGSLLTSLDPQTGSQKWQKDVGSWDN